MQEKERVSNSLEQNSDEYWEQVQEVGQLKMGEATTVKFQRGITKKDKRDVISMRAWVAGKRYSGPTKQGFNLDLKTAEEVYNLPGKALGKAQK